MQAIFTETKGAGLTLAPAHLPNTVKIQDWSVIQSFTSHFGGWHSIYV